MVKFIKSDKKITHPCTESNWCHSITLKIQIGIATKLYKTSALKRSGYFGDFLSRQQPSMAESRQQSRKAENVFSAGQPMCCETSYCKLPHELHAKCKTNSEG